MQLEKIILRDFGCFQGERDFELTEGVNLIFGPNFSGKSTLVNIIFFTLTGKPIVPRVEASAIKNPYAKQGTGTAGLQFAENGSQYQLFRATGKRILLRSPKANGWHIHFDDSRVTFAASQLQERFGLSHQHLALTAFLREGEIFEFLARQPATRRDILYALLGIDRLIEVRERFIDARRLAKGEERRINSYQNSLRFRAQGPHGAEIQKIEAKLKELEAAYSAETGDAALIAEWMQSRERLQTQLETLTREQADALSGFADMAQLRQMISKIEAAIAESAGIEGHREILLQQLGRLDSHIATLTTVCDTLRALIENDNGHCPTCHQKVEPATVQRIIDEKESEKSALAAELAERKEQLAKQTAELNNRQALEQRLQTIQANATRFEQLAQAIDETQRELDALEARLKEKGVEDRVRESTPTLRDKERLKAQMDSERRRLVNLKQQEAVRLDRMNELQRVNRQAGKVEQTRLGLELACEGVDKTIASLQRQILQPVEAELQAWLEQMELFGRTRIDLQKQHLLPSLTIDGVDRSLMLLSGSEKMFLYLCFKVALAKVLGNPGFFVFDDPTLHLDAERKALMVAFIRQLAEEHQVIVTSYDDEVRAGLVDAHLIEMHAL